MKQDLFILYLVFDPKLHMLTHGSPPSGGAYAPPQLGNLISSNIADFGLTPFMRFGCGVSLDCFAFRMKGLFKKSF